MDVAREGQDIPWGMLFCGPLYMLLYIERFKDASGRDRCWVYCSDVLKSDDPKYPLVTFVLFMMLAPTSVVANFFTKLSGQRPSIIPGLPGNVAEKMMSQFQMDDDGDPDLGSTVETSSGEGVQVAGGQDMVRDVIAGSSCID